MSTPAPGPSRRRRIAGERRTARPLTTQAPAPREPVRARVLSSDRKPPTAPKPPKTPQTPRSTRPRRARAGGPAAPGGWWGSAASVAVLAGVLVLAVVLSGLLALGLLGNRGIEEIREASTTQQSGLSASAAAERAAAAILAYDYRSLDADQAAAERFMTPAFASQYRTVFVKTIKPTASETKAKVTAMVQGSSVLRAAPDRVRVLMFVDQTTVSTANRGPQKALNRVEFDMVERSGTWLVDDIGSF